jgi:type II secretory pathway component PulF
MLFSGRVPLSAMIELCRVLRHSLSAGLRLPDVFERQARKGAAPLRPIATRIADGLRAGDTLSEALEREQKAFPPMFLALASVGEKTGNLPEIFAELEKYYIIQQRFWRQFWSAATLPIIQYVAAVFIIAGTIWIMGIIAAMNSTAATGPLGKAFSGSGGALRFLIMNFGTIALLIVLYKLFSRSLRHKAVVDRFLLGLPVVGPFLMSFNLARLSTSLRLTLDSGMSPAKAVALSLKATGNAAFESRSKVVQDSIRSGESLTTALTQARLFPDEFLHIVGAAEEGGRVPEAMVQQAEQYTEDAELKLRVLSKMMGFGVWLAVAGFIVYMIFKTAFMYIGALENAIG